MYKCHYYCPCCHGEMKTELCFGLCMLQCEGHWMPYICKRMQNLSDMKDHTYASHEYRSDNGWNWQHDLIHCFAIAKHMCEKLTAKGQFASKSPKVAC